MVPKYVKALEGRVINEKTSEIWKIQDVGRIWKADVEKQINADGYEIIEDGTVVKKEVDESAEDTEETAEETN